MEKNSRHLSAIVSIIFLFLFVAALWFDPLAAHMPKTADMKALSRAVSFLGKGSFLIAALFFLYIAGHLLKKEKLKNAAWRGGFSLIIAGAAVQLLKAAFERPRMGFGGNATMALLENPSLFDIAGRFDSFPSGHTALSFSIAYSLSGVYPAARFFLYPLAALIGGSRIYLGSHYPTDTVAGAALGILVGYSLQSENLRRAWQNKALVFLIVFISFFKLGGFLLFDLDETIFSESAREMIKQGNFLTPIYNGLPRYDKPIFFYWLLVSAFKVFGTTEFAARFFSAVSGVALAAMTFFFVKRVKGQRAALWSTVALALNLGYFTYTHAAVVDMALCFFVSASLFSFYLALHENNPGWFFPFWTASALAVLTKGAVGIVFPLSISVIYIAAFRDFKRLRGLFNPYCLFIFLAIALPWFAAQFYINGREFFDAFIMKHHIERYTGAISGHRGPFYYYIGILLAGFFPWAAVIPDAIYGGIKKREGLLTFCAIWFLFILVFFTAARTKLPNYILPLFPAASIMAGLRISEFIGGSGKKAWLYIMSAISCLSALALFMLPFSPLKTINFPPSVFFTFGLILFAISLFSAVALLRPPSGLYGIAGAVLLLLVSLRVYVLPPVNLYLQKTLYNYSTYVKNLSTDGNYVLATYRLNKPSINFYSEKETLNLGKKDARTIEDLSLKANLILVTKTSLYEEVKKIHDLRVLDKKDDYILLTNIAGLRPI